MPAADPSVSPEPATWQPHPGRTAVLLWGSGVGVLLGLGVLGFFVGRASLQPSQETEMASTAPQSQPALETQAAEEPLPSPELSSASEAQPVPTSPATEGPVAEETTPVETTSAASPSAAPIGDLPPGANPRELPVQVVGEPALRVDATYEPRGNNLGGITGFIVRGTMANPTQNRVERVVLTFTATGAIVVSQAAYEALIRQPGTTKTPAPAPYWNREVILAYQPTILSNLAPGETRPFEFMAPTNVANPPGLRPGEVVQGGQPQEVSLLVRAEGLASSGAPIFPLQRP